MRILFTSDLHDDREAIARYAGILGSRDFDIGVVAGDIMEYDLTLERIGRTPGVRDDDLLEELYDPDDTVEELDERVRGYRKSRHTPLYKAVKHGESGLRKILCSAGKPVALVTGNHDLAEWHSDGLIHNVHNKAFEHGGLTFVGFKYTSLEIDPARERRYIRRIEESIKDRTVLVTHAPPYGTLDANHRGTHIGSRAIAGVAGDARIILHLFGHVHHSFGHLGKSANGSWVGGRKFIAIDSGGPSFDYIE